MRDYFKFRVLLLKFLKKGLFGLAVGAFEAQEEVDLNRLSGCCSCGQELRGKHHQTEQPDENGAAFM